MKPDISNRDLVLRLRERLQTEQARLKLAYESSANATAMLRGRSALIDDVLDEAWQHFALPVKCALAAVGGYGRGELYPASDIDILLLLPDELDGTHEESITTLIGILWDIGLEVGHSVRTVTECIVEARRDITIQTTLLEARLISGNSKTFADFNAAIRTAFDPQTFAKAKRLEQQDRHSRYDDTAFSLEPNAKESPGGLRDLHILLWIARAAGLGQRWRELATHGICLTTEAHQLERCERFLQHVRIRLHYLAKRREDRLLFDHQEAIAQAFGIERNKAKRASELLMQRYYRNAKSIVQLNTLLLQNLEERLFPAHQSAPIFIDAHFQMQRDLLDIRDEAVFQTHPHTILKSFLLLQQRSELKGMTARMLRAVWRARGCINADFRRNPTHRALFLSMFQQKRGIVHEMRRMNHYDILGHYLPAFGKIVGQMQHDLFHAYTVDQHIMQVLRNVRRYTMPEFAHEFPLCSRLISSFDRHWLIYIAVLFHDIAKGRGGDHSKLGAIEARRFCNDHGLDEEDAELVIFLVSEHLTMSSVAQKKDLSDPDVITAFAETVKTDRRLVALYLLTVADIRGTSPKVWNAWKGKLLEDLYAATHRLLKGATPDQALGLDARQENARHLLRRHGLRPGIEENFWKELDTVYFMRHDADEIAWHTRTLYHCPDSADPIVRARPNQAGEGLHVMVYVQDQPVLFARLCGFFSRMGYSIVDAKIHTTRHGYALDSFILLDSGLATPYRDMIGLIEHDLTDCLKRQADLEPPVQGRLSRQLRNFPIVPEVLVHPDEKGQYHVMTVIAADRPGLLYAIALNLAGYAITIHTAKIATLGERVEDTFLISGERLAQSATRIQMEQDLLQILQV